MITAIIPHLSRPLTDATLAVCVRALRENTSAPIEIIVVEGGGDPYDVWNRYAKIARYESLLFLSDDMVMGPAWDAHMVTRCVPNTILTGYLVEPGVIPPAAQNIHKDFGRTAETFEWHAFMDFCRYNTVGTPDVTNNMGWYMPLMVRREWFLEFGGYPTPAPFPNPNDMLLWDKARAAGVDLLRVNSYAYHFQNVSNPSHDWMRTRL